MIDLCGGSARPGRQPSPRAPSVGRAAVGVGPRDRAGATSTNDTVIPQRGTSLTAGAKDGGGEGFGSGRTDASTTTTSRGVRTGVGQWAGTRGSAPHHKTVLRQGDGSLPGVIPDPRGTRDLTTRREELVEEVLRTTRVYLGLELAEDAVKELTAEAFAAADQEYGAEEAAAWGEENFKEGIRWRITRGC